MARLRSSNSSTRPIGNPGSSFWSALEHPVRMWRSGYSAALTVLNWRQEHHGCETRASGTATIIPIIALAWRGGKYGHVCADKSQRSWTRSTSVA